MNGKARLFMNMLIKGILGFGLLSLLLFGCAGSFRYWNAWLFLGSLLVCMLTMGLILFFRHPQTLERRLRTREPERAQRVFVALTGVSYLLAFALAGLDFRFGWTSMPVWGVFLCLGIMVAGYGLYSAVTLKNTYASRTVEVQKGQELITDGPYAVVRHPMYLASLLLFMPMPLLLGSWVAAVPMLLLPVLLGMRIRNEEAMLRAGLAGYEAYMRKVRYRLVPFIW